VTEQNTNPEPEENDVEAHSADVLGLQKFDVNKEAEGGMVAFSCSSCVAGSCSAEV